jgi:hypothetical protein
LPFIAGRTDTLLGCTVYEVKPPDRLAPTSERDIPYFYPFRAANHHPVEIAGAWTRFPYVAHPVAADPAHRAVNPLSRRRRRRKRLSVCLPTR